MAADGSPRATPSRREVRDLRGAIVRAVNAASSGRYRVEITVPGRHYGGLSNNELLEVLADQGRDFAAPTTAMRHHVRATVALLFEGASRVPTARQIDEAMDRAVIEWVVKRFEGRVRDVRIRHLTIPYAKAKAKAGYPNAPVGIRTGSLVAAVEDHGRVTIVR